jgi:hypothetical protein
MDGSELVIRYETRGLAPPALGRMRSLEESNPFFAPPSP